MVEIGNVVKYPKRQIRRKAEAQSYGLGNLKPNHGLMASGSKWKVEDLPFLWRVGEKHMIAERTDNEIVVSCQFSAVSKSQGQNIFAEWAFFIKKSSFGFFIF